MELKAEQELGWSTQLEENLKVLNKGRTNTMNILCHI